MKHDDVHFIDIIWVLFGAPADGFDTTFNGFIECEFGYSSAVLTATLVAAVMTTVVGNGFEFEAEVGAFFATNNGIEYGLVANPTEIEVEFLDVFNTPYITYNEINEDEIIVNENKINVECNVLNYGNDNGIMFDFLSNINGYYKEYPNTVNGHLINSNFAGYFAGLFFYGSFIFFHNHWILKNTITSIINIFRNTSICIIYISNSRSSSTTNNNKEEK